MGDALDRLRGMIEGDEVALSGSASVSGYTKKDGTRVSGYVRHGGALGRLVSNFQTAKTGSDGLLNKPKPQSVSEHLESLSDAELKKRANDGNFLKIDRDGYQAELNRRNGTSHKTPAIEKTIGSNIDPNSPLAKWYAAAHESKVDDYGRAAAEKLSDADLADAIRHRDELNADAKYGMSGRHDLDVLRAEQARRKNAAKKS